MSDRTRTAFVYAIYYSVVSCTVVNVVALGMWLAYVLPRIDSKTGEVFQIMEQVATENAQQTKVIQENHDLLIENGKLLQANHQLQVQNSALVRQWHDELMRMKKGGAAHE